MASTDDLVAEYVRATMRVEPPPSLSVEVMRSVTVMPQERRGWLSTFGPYTPAIVAVAAAGLIVAIGSLITSPTNLGPADPSGEPSAVPAPTLTPEDARILTEPGDVIRIPAFDASGQFGMIRLERGDEFGSYPDYIPTEAMRWTEVFFVEIYVSYELDRPTSDSFGSIDFGWAVDVDGDGVDADDVISQHIGYDIMGVELQSGPTPLLPCCVSGSLPISGWVALELPEAGAEYDIYLVQLAESPSDDPTQYTPWEAVNSALLREPGPPVGVTAFDFENLPPSLESAPPMTNLQRLPTPPPSPAPTFEPIADAAADELFAETQTCTNTVTGVTVTFPASWHTNELYVDPPDYDLPACTFFGPEPIDAKLVWEGLTNERPPIHLADGLGWVGGQTDNPAVAQAAFARAPIGDRFAWVITYPDLPDNPPLYLVPLTDDPYGAVLRGMGERAVLERILVRLEFDE